MRSDAKDVDSLLQQEYDYYDCLALFSKKLIHQLRTGMHLMKQKETELFEDFFKTTDQLIKNGAIELDKEKCMPDVRVIEALNVTQINPENPEKKEDVPHNDSANS